MHLYSLCESVSKCLLIFIHVLLTIFKIVRVGLGLLQVVATSVSCVLAYAKQA